MKTNHSLVGWRCRVENDDDVQKINTNLLWKLYEFQITYRLSMNRVYGKKHGGDETWQLRQEHRAHSENIETMCKYCVMKDSLGV